MAKIKTTEYRSPLDGEIFGDRSKHPNRVLHVVEGQENDTMMLLEGDCMHYNLFIHEVEASDEHDLAQLIDDVLVSMIHSDYRVCTVAVDPFDVYLAEVLQELGFAKLYHVLGLNNANLSRHLYHRQLQ